MPVTFNRVFAEIMALSLSSDAAGRQSGYTIPPLRRQFNATHSGTKAALQLARVTVSRNETPSADGSSPSNVHRHDDVQVVLGFGADRADDAGAGGAAEVQVYLARVQRIQRVAQVAAVEGDLLGLA